MIDSRKLEDLSPEAALVCKRHIDGCAAAGIDLIITSTHRDIEKQDQLYLVGRLPGDLRKKVTNAKGGESWHQFKCAWDVVPVIGGKCVWDDEHLWKRVVDIGVAIGAEAGALWKTFPDRPHFQYKPVGVTLATALSRYVKYKTIFTEGLEA